MWCLNLWLTYLDLDFHLWLDMRSCVFRVLRSHIGRLGSCNGTRIARQALLNDLWKGPTTLRPTIGIVVLSYWVIHCLKPYQYVSVLKDFLLRWHTSRFQSQSTARLAAGEGCSCSAFVSTLPLQERLEACGKWLRTCFFFFLRLTGIKPVMLIGCRFPGQRKGLAALRRNAGAPQKIGDWSFLQISLRNCLWTAQLPIAEVKFHSRKCALQKAWRRRNRKTIR